VDTLVLKLVLTPTLIGTASLAGRRFGPAVSGWLVGFPFTSAPVALFLAMNEGVAFAATAAAGTMAGTISQAAFSVAYGWMARRVGWPLCVAGSSVAFALSTFALRRLSLPLLPLFLVVVVALVAALRLMPVPNLRRLSSTAVPRWDIAARMVVATAFVLLLTGIANALGPELTGLLSPFPLYAGILAAFGHHFHGPQSAIAVLRGLILGLFAFAGFFLALSALIERAGVALAFAAAIAVALAIQAGALWRLHRGASVPPRTEDRAAVTKN